jgi:hypothetical protein
VKSAGTSPRPDAPKGPSRNDCAWGAPEGIATNRHMGRDNGRNRIPEPERGRLGTSLAFHRGETSTHSFSIATSLSRLRGRLPSAGQVTGCPSLSPFFCWESGQSRITSAFGRGGPLAAGCDAEHGCRGGRIPSRLDLPARTVVLGTAAGNRQGEGEARFRQESGPEVQQCRHPTPEKTSSPSPWLCAIALGCESFPVVFSDAIC